MYLFYTYTHPYEKITVVFKNKTLLFNDLYVKMRIKVSLENFGNKSGYFYPQIFYTWLYLMLLMSKILFIFSKATDDYRK